MNSDAKSIGLGLLIGGGIAIVLIAGAFIAGVFPPQVQPTPTVQQITSIESVIIPTETPTSAPTVESILTFYVSLTPDAETVLAEQVIQSLPDYGGEWNTLIRANGNRTVFAYNADRQDHVASMIKLPFALLFFKSLAAKGIQPAQYAEYLSTHGIGRTYEQLLRAMLVESEEFAAQTLREYVRESEIDVNAALESWGASHTDLSSRYSTPEDIATLYESLYYGRAVTPEARAIILDYMSAYTPNDDTRLGVLRPLLPSGAKFYNKRGSITDGRLVIGDSALLTWNQNGVEKVYVIVMLGYNGERPTTDKKLTRGIETTAYQFWNYVINNP